MKPEQTPFTLESGEACVKIPNSVIERNKKAWDSFILGQFYEEPPAKGAVHAIVNVIWSRQKRDISVSKMDGHAFLFRVPCPNARRKILSQSLWQVDGQTMFVAKWSPGPHQEKPELSMVPVWLDLTGVPLQFFNRDALKEIAGLVGHPIELHPTTANLTNLKVARVYTVIDPRKPLPEGVNAQFESGEIHRITVSSPWLPSLCSFCKKVGHTISRCKAAPRTCTICNSARHTSDLCPRNRPKQREGKAPVKSQLPITSSKQIYRPKDTGTTSKVPEKAVPNDPPKDLAVTNQVHVSQDTLLLASDQPKSPQINKATQNNQKQTFAEVSASTARKSDPITKGSVPYRSLLPQISTPKTSKANPSSSIIAFDYDVSRGGLVVDLSPHFTSSYAAPSNDESYSSQQCLSSPETLSEGDDNPDDENDQFIQVMTKRMRRQSLARARGRGPLSL